tara:strand:- start:2423 stop:2728 length:306 start_codon:yes stop_codon:yes gene_type:complete
MQKDTIKFLFEAIDDVVNGYNNSGRVSRLNVELLASWKTIVKAEMEKRQLTLKDVHPSMVTEVQFEADFTVPEPKKKVSRPKKKATKRPVGRPRKTELKVV